MALFIDRFVRTFSVSGNSSFQSQRTCGALFLHGDPNGLALEFLEAIGHHHFFDSIKFGHYRAAEFFRIDVA